MLKLSSSAKTSVTSGLFNDGNQELSGHFMGIITGIKRFPLVVPPIVKLGVEGPALLLSEAPPSGRTFLQRSETAHTIKHLLDSVLQYATQINSFQVFIYAGMICEKA